MAGGDVARLTKLILDFRDARDWAQFHNPKDIALSLSLEASEVLEFMQWKNGDELAGALKAQEEDVADELSDVLYWTLLLAHELGIDLPAAFENKMRKNERKYPVAKAKGRSAKYSEL